MELSSESIDQLLVAVFLMSSYDVGLIAGNGMFAKSEIDYYAPGWRPELSHQRSRWTLAGEAATGMCSRPAS